MSELSGNDARLRFVNTRLILSIGVDLYTFTAAEDRDERKVRATVDTLQKMGFLSLERGRVS